MHAYIYTVNPTGHNSGLRHTRGGGNSILTKRMRMQTRVNVSSTNGIIWPTVESNAIAVACIVPRGGCADVHAVRKCLLWCGIIITRHSWTSISGLRKNSPKRVFPSSKKRGRWFDYTISLRMPTHISINSTGMVFVHFATEREDLTHSGKRCHSSGLCDTKGGGGGGGGGHIGWGGPSTGPTPPFYCSSVFVPVWAAAGRLLWWWWWRRGGVRYFVGVHFSDSIITHSLRMQTRVNIRGNNGIRPLCYAVSGSSPQWGARL